MPCHAIQDLFRCADKSRVNFHFSFFWHPLFAIYTPQNHKGRPFPPFLLLLLLLLLLFFLSCLSWLGIGFRGHEEKLVLVLWFQVSEREQRGTPKTRRKTQWRFPGCRSNAKGSDIKLQFELGSMKLGRAAPLIIYAVALLRCYAVPLSCLGSLSAPIKSICGRPNEMNGAS